MKKCIHCEIELNESNTGFCGFMGDMEYNECISCMDQMDSIMRDIESGAKKFEDFDWYIV